MKVFLKVYKDRHGQIALTIEDENGGYKLAGNKFDGTAIPLLTVRLDSDDKAHILSYLNKIEDK